MLQQLQQKLAGSNVKKATKPVSLHISALSLKFMLESFCIKQNITRQSQTQV